MDYFRVSSENPLEAIFPCGEYGVDFYSNSNGEGIDIKRVYRKSLITKLNVWMPYSEKVYHNVDGKPKQEFVVSFHPQDEFRVNFVFVDDGKIFPSLIIKDEKVALPKEDLGICKFFCGDLYKKLKLGKENLANVIDFDNVSLDFRDKLSRYYFQRNDFPSRVNVRIFES